MRSAVPRTVDLPRLQQAVRWRTDNGLAERAVRTAVMTRVPLTILPAPLLLKPSLTIS